MKIAPTTYGGFYMKYLLVFACFFGSLLIGPAALAQKPKLTTTTVADDTYGKGGTKETWSDGEFRIHQEVWKNKEGKVKEQHKMNYQADKLLSEAWEFQGDGEAYAAAVNRSGRSSNDKTGNFGFSESYALPGSRDVFTYSGFKEMTPEAIKKKIEEIEKQFAKDGTLPKQLIGEEPKEAPKKEKEVDINVEPPDLSKQKQVFSGAGAEKAAAEKIAAEEAAFKKDFDNLSRILDEPVAECDQLKTKIKTAQDELGGLERKIAIWASYGRDYDQWIKEAREGIGKAEKDGNEAQRKFWVDLANRYIEIRDDINEGLSEFSSDKEKISKKIDELLNRLADCPKQEPIDAQFDCLKSKFPEIRLMVGKKDRAWDPASKRDFDWDTDKQAWIDGDTKESICPPSGIDPCLVGTWECTSFKEPNNKVFTGGGTGFRVTFKSDGTETVDYSSMQPTKAGPIDTIAFTGKASAKISTDKGIAKIEAMQNAGVSMTVKSTGRVWTMKYPGLGPGGLGSPENKNNYKCTEDSLEYQTSYQRGQYTCAVKFTKVKSP